MSPIQDVWNDGQGNPAPGEPPAPRIEETAKEHDSYITDLEWSILRAAADYRKAWDEAQRMKRRGEDPLRADCHHFANVLLQTITETLP